MISRLWNSRPALVSLFVLGVALPLCLAGSRANAEEEGPLWTDKPHHVSIVVAGSVDQHETAFTLGLDYEYRLNELLGFGVVVEHAFEKIDATTLLGVVDLHIWRGFAIQTGPGVEFVHGKGEEGDEEEFTYRIGALYEFEFGRFTFSPQLHYDVTTGENSLVFGGAFGVAF